MLLKKVVVAEDDDSIALMIATALGDAGFLCLRAKDGDEALTLVRRESPDCLILDIMMPHTDGLEVAKRLKSDVLASRIPILMTTALGSVKDKIKGLDAGADDYLAKPFDLRELAARVRALIRTSNRERDRNPATNLPGSYAVDDRVEQLFRNKQDFACLYTDLSGFQQFTDSVGFKRTDEFIGELGRVFLERARKHGDGTGFVGHIGGDDFVLIVAPDVAEELAQGLIGDFKEFLLNWSSDASNSDAQLDAMHLSIAVVNTAQAKITGPEELSKAVAKCKRLATTKDESHVEVWQG